MIIVPMLGGLKGSCLRKVNKLPRFNKEVLSLNGDKLSIYIVSIVLKRKKINKYFFKIEDNIENQ